MTPELRTLIRELYSEGLTVAEIVARLGHRGTKLSRDDVRAVVYQGQPA